MKIQVLVGMISSGKTTYSKNLAKSGYLTMNDDGVVNLVHGGQYTLYEKGLKPLYKSIENHIFSLAVILNRNLCIDRGLDISSSSRKRWIDLANSMDVEIEAVVFKNEGPEIHAQRRFISDARGHPYEYWLKVANKHNSSFEEPSTSEGFSKIHKISFDQISKGVIFV